MKEVVQDANIALTDKNTALVYADGLLRDMNTLKGNDDIAKEQAFINLVLAGIFANVEGGTKAILDAIKAYQDDGTIDVKIGEQQRRRNDAIEEVLRADGAVKASLKDHNDAAAYNAALGSSESSSGQEDPIEPLDQTVKPFTGGKVPGIEDTLPALYRCEAPGGCGQNASSEDPKIRRAHHKTCNEPPTCIGRVYWSCQTPSGQCPRFTDHEEAICRGPCGEKVPNAFGIPVDGTHQTTCAFNAWKSEPIQINGEDFIRKTVVPCPEGTYYHCGPNGARNRPCPNASNHIAGSDASNFVAPAPKTIPVVQCSNTNRGGGACIHGRVVSGDDPNEHQTLCSAGHDYWTCNQRDLRKHQDRTCGRCGLIYQKCSNHSQACQNTRWHVKSKETSNNDTGNDETPLPVVCPADGWTNCGGTVSHETTCGENHTYYTCNPGAVAAHSSHTRSNTTDTDTDTDNTDTGTDTVSDTGDSPESGSDTETGSRTDSGDTETVSVAAPVCGNTATGAGACVYGRMALSPTAHQTTCLAGDTYWSCSATEITLHSVHTAPLSVVCPADSWTGCGGTTSHETTCPAGHAYYSCDVSAVSSHSDHMDAETKVIDIQPKQVTLSKAGRKQTLFLSTALWLK